jgi:hypothetical protein
VPAATISRNPSQVFGSFSRRLDLTSTVRGPLAFDDARLDSQTLVADCPAGFSSNKVRTLAKRSRQFDFAENSRSRTCEIVAFAIFLKILVAYSFPFATFPRS